MDDADSPENVGGQGEALPGGLLEDPAHVRADARLIERAVRGQWAVADNYRSEITAKLMQIVRTDSILVRKTEGAAQIESIIEGPNHKNQIAAAKVFVAMVNTNQADEHKAADYARIDQGKPTAGVKHSGTVDHIHRLDAVLQRLIDSNMPRSNWPQQVVEYEQRRVKLIAG